MESLANKYSTETQSSEYIPEKRLWRAVICQALYDALSSVENKATPYRIKEKAQNWFIYNSGNFKRACELAGFDADYLSKKVCKLIQLKKLKKSGIVWNAKNEEVVYGR
jgi:hypothetical protein